MSLISAVRDYVEVINANVHLFHHTFGKEITLFAFLKSSIYYFVQSIALGFLYLLTFPFQWLRDLTYLPVIIPEFTLDTFRETFAGFTYRNVPSLTGLTFFGTPTLLENKFLVGLFNSFFASLPLTFAHLRGIHHLYCKGWLAAVANNAGIILGHLFFLTAVLFGWRPVLIPWLQFEPWTYLITVLITYSTIQGAFDYRRNFQYMQKREELLKTAMISFVLTIGDQGVLFKYLSTMTGGLEPTYFEPLTGTAMSITQQHLLYIFAFGLGSIVFAAFFLKLALWVRFQITERLFITDPIFARRFNHQAKIAFIAMFCVSLSFYGLDYLVAKPLGYVPYDRALVVGTLAPYTREDHRIKKLGIPAKAPYLPKEEAEEKFDVDNLDMDPDILASVRKQHKKELERDSMYERGIKKLKKFPIPMNLSTAKYDRGVHLARAMGASYENRFTENFRLPTSQFWMTRSYRKQFIRKNFVYDFLKGYLNVYDKFKFRVFLPFLKRIGLYSDELTVKEKERLKIEEAKAAEKARYRRAVQAFWMGRMAGLTSLGAQRGSRQLFDQFMVYENILPLWYPHNPPLTEEERVMLNEVKSILRSPKAELQENFYRMIDLLEEYIQSVGRFRDIDNVWQPPHRMMTRPTLVRLLISDILKGQTVRQHRSSRMMAFWPEVYGFFNEIKASKMVKQSILHDLIRHNPIMYVLFRTDIDLFLQRQPREQRISQKDEAELYFKRILLKNLIHTTAKYRRILNRNPALNDAFRGSKSLANKVYNHQFNGTYKFTRQLMHVDIDPIRNNPLHRVVKYDQPLFSDGKTRLTSVHEELLPKLASPTTRSKGSPARRPRRPLGQHFLIRAGNTRPFYAGWDEDRRAFVLTNRFLPTRVSSRLIPFNEKYPEFAPLNALAMERSTTEKTEKTEKKAAKAKELKRIAFTTWPIPSKIANDPLLWRNHQGVFMGERANRYNVRFSSKKAELLTPEGRAKRTKARNARFIIHHFLPDLDFRPLQILFTEGEKFVDPEEARRVAQARIDQLTPHEHEQELEQLQEGEQEEQARGRTRRKSNPYSRPNDPVNFVGDYVDDLDEFDFEFIKIGEPWPTGFYVQRKLYNIWWLEEKPPVPFADRGGYVWPGQEQLKVRVREFIPKWWKLPELPFEF